MNVQKIDKAKADRLIALLAERNGGSVPMTKLLKLLYYVDFTAAARLGHPVTGGVYCAWDMGPVCVPVYKDVPQGLFPSVMAAESEDALLVYARPDADHGGPVFSAEEMAIIDEVWSKYGGLSGKSLSEKTHHELPWLVARKNNQKVMDYDIAGMEFDVDDEDNEVVEEDDASRAALARLDEALRQLSGAKG